jgi:hypothetical protein
MALSAVEVFVIIACVALLAAVFLPALARSKARSSRLNCGNNLKQIGLGFVNWSLDNNDHYPMQVSVTNGGTMELIASGSVYCHFQVMSNELSTPKILLCPNDEQRSCAINFGIATNFGAGLTDKNLSYFVNVGATRNDGSGLLIGDRNITNRPRPGSPLVSLSQGDTIGWTKEIHSGKGYLGFNDGRVELFKNRGVGAAIKIGEGDTNWLAVP